MHSLANRLAWLVVVLATALLIVDDASAQRRGRRSKSRRPRPQPVAQQQPQPLSILKPLSDTSAIAEEFVATEYRWPETNGEIIITYSYSNLLDEGLNGLTALEIQAATEEALAVWASVAPLHFVEVEDEGPAPSDRNYDGEGLPMIRFGAHDIDGAAGDALAHAFLPTSVESGLAGDVHFDIDEDWGAFGVAGFLEVVLHELGHSLGLDHEQNVIAIMNPVYAGRFEQLGDAFLFDDDIEGIQFLYGEGAGSVSPLDGPVDEPDGDEPDGDEPNGDEPNGDEPDGDEPDGDAGDGGQGDPSDEPDEPGDEGDSTSEVSSVEATVVDGVLTIEGAAADDQLLLVGSRWLSVVVGLDGTQVNGQRWSLHFGADEVVCGLNGGDDVVWLLRSNLQSLTCDMGAGDDALILIFSRLQNFNAVGGADEDLLIRIASVAIREALSGFESLF